VKNRNLEIPKLSCINQLQKISTAFLEVVYVSEPKNSLYWIEELRSVRTDAHNISSLGWTPNESFIDVIVRKYQKSSRFSARKLA
jgi:hypothetical protein